MSNLKSPKIWLHGLFAAFIGGAATAVSCLVVEPATFNFAAGLSSTLKVAAVSGLISAAAYLKQSPLPPIEE